MKKTTFLPSSSNSMFMMQLLHLNTLPGTAYQVRTPQRQRGLDRNNNNLQIFC